MKNSSPYLQSSKVVSDRLNTSLSDGLSDSDATDRLKKFGPNRLQLEKRRSVLSLFLKQFKDVLIIILIVAAAVSWGAGYFGGGEGLGESGASHGSESASEAILIGVIVLAIAVVGFLNEYRAEKTIEALKKLVSQKVTVTRGGRKRVIDSDVVVPGDIVYLQEGDKVPADIRLFKVNGLKINEASLTGESLPVAKNTLAAKSKQSLGDQKCMAFAGTIVSQGTAEGVVVATAQKTQLGLIADLVGGVEERPTPMQHKLDVLGKKLGLAVLLICLIVFLSVWLLVDADTSSQTQKLIFAFTAAVALAVAAIPEGLAFVVRISLALGARRLAAKNALVRKLSAVEALGSTDVVCSDKTGTITEGKMKVRSLYVYGADFSLEHQPPGRHTGKALELLMRTGFICNNARLEGDKQIGDPTEVALLVATKEVLSTKVDLTHRRIKEIPFTSQRKMMSVVVAEGSALCVYTKGATETVLDRCSHYIDDHGRRHKLGPKSRERIVNKNKLLASQALRVLAFAFNPQTADNKDEDLEKDLTFIGLQGMIDPPRKEVAGVISRVQSRSGIKVVMITGDYPETAAAIAKEVGIKGRVMSGQELDEITEDQLRSIVSEVGVYARVNPEHKLKIVQALQAKGHQVAMTGDGVNDAPAIKAADIGVAMGVTGTDASREAADMILLDDQFLTIIDAIEEGRGIYDNVRKFVTFLVSCNLAEVVAILVGVILYQDLILTAVQILFINIVTDGMPAVALGSDPAAKNSLDNKPSRYRRDILDKRVWLEVVLFGAVMSSLLVIQYAANLGTHGSLAATSGVFMAYVVYELVRLVDIRTDYRMRWFSNPWLTVAIIASLSMQMVVMYVPVVANYFEVQAIRLDDWLFMLLGSVIIFSVMKLANPVLNRVAGQE